jgi:hypothetical protein
MVAGYDIIINAGQSNSSGGGLGPFTESDASKDGQIFQMGRYAPNNLLIIPATRNLQYVSTPDGTSYDLTLARLYARDYLASDRNVLVIPAAHSGTSILNWLDYVRSNFKSEYLDMRMRANLGLSQTGLNRVVAWFEHQGEEDISIIGDTGDARHPLMSSGNDYYVKKLELIDRVRRDFGFIPMVFGLFTHNDSGSAAAISVIAAIRRAITVRQGCFITETSGLETNSDIGQGSGGHFSSAGYEVLATRHFSNFALALETMEIPIHPA